MLQLPTWFDPLTGGEGGSPEFQTQSNNPFSMKFLPYFEGRITLLMSFLAIWKNRQAWLRGKSLVIENTIRNRLLVFTLSFPSVLMSFSWALHCTELAEAHSSACVCVCVCVCACVHVCACVCVGDGGGRGRQVPFSHLHVKLQQAPDGIGRFASGAVTSHCLQITSSCFCTLPKRCTDEEKNQPGWSSESWRQIVSKQEKWQPKTQWLEQIHL